MSALFLANVVLVAGCVTLPRGPEEIDVSAKRFMPRAGKARIYVFRKGGGSGRGIIAIDGTFRGEVDRDRYVFGDVDPGPHSVTAQWHGGNPDVTRLEVAAAADAVYFVRYPGLPLNPFDRPRLSTVSEAEGRKAVLACALAPIP